MFTRHLLKQKFFSSKGSLIRVVALAAASSGLIYSHSNSNINSVSLHLSDSLYWPWRTMQEMILPHSSFVSLGPSSYATGSIPAANDKTDAFGEAGSSPKPCCGCLGRDTLANAAARIGPAVVNLSVPKGFHGLTVGKSIGSGTIIDKDGTILTCAHVVVDFQGLSPSSKGKSWYFPGYYFKMAKIHQTPLVILGAMHHPDVKSFQVDVTLQDGRTFEGTVVNADLHSDIAIVKIRSKTPLPAAKLGSSSMIRPGDWVVAVGCPLTLQNTVTAGIVSCVDRKSSDLGLGGMGREYLQTDCAINAGNSGGPLVNIDGEVIGVNIMKVLAADGLSFSVPIDSVSKIIEHFKRNGRVVRPWLGLKMLDLNDMIVAQLKEKDAKFPDVSKGVLVPMVTPGSPAERAGFVPGDVVVEFEGMPVGSIKEIIEIMGDKTGQPLKAVVKRANNRSVTLTVIPEEANP